MKREESITPNLHMVAWELTRSCNLFCAHCRSSSTAGAYKDELSTEECFRLIDAIVEIGKPVVILSGGEPLLRRDLFQIAGYAVEKGLRVVMGTNGTLITGDIAAKLKAVPVSRVAVSIDFPTNELQDKFRGQSGAFQAAASGIALLRQAGVEVQINSTITRLNMKYLNELLDLALKSGAVAFHPFMLVPTGRGKGLETVAMSPEEYEQTLNWVYDRQKELGNRIFFKPTDAPHYQRIIRQKAKESNSQETQRGGKTATKTRSGYMNSMTRGCLAGISFCFISHRGKVQGCGYLDVEAGNIRDRSFKQIWTESTLFRELRDLSKIKGKCGACEYKYICGGCRARAYEATGDYLEAEPYCIYKPPLLQKGKYEHESRNAFRNYSNHPEPLSCHSEGALRRCHSEPSEESHTAQGKLREESGDPSLSLRVTIKNMELDNVDKTLLNIIQAEFPLSREPFSVLGFRLGLTSNEIIRRIDRLKAAGIIRLIGPVLNPKKLGYQTTLVAAKVPVEQMDKASQIISRHPMVSHCYQRDHDFNLWFTLAIPVTKDVDDEVRKLGNRIKSETILNLPAIKTFKIGAYFDLDGGNSHPSLPVEGAAISGLSHGHAVRKNKKLSTTERTVINALQQDLPLSEKPFDLISGKLHMDTDKFLSHCQTLLQRGIMRRFSASVNHNKLGFTANAMACWKVPSDMVDTAGKKIATFPEVSHCYERQISPLWPYNLFAMTHAHNKENCRAVTDKICSETGLNRNEMLLLFSSKEVKKTRVRYTI